MNPLLCRECAAERLYPEREDLTGIVFDQCILCGKALRESAATRTDESLKRFVEALHVKAKELTKDLLTEDSNE